MSKIDLASPVVKWVGGKRQLLERYWWWCCIICTATRERNYQ